MTAAESTRPGTARLPSLRQAPAWLALAIIVTIPLLFGAVHPIVRGGYVAIILVGLGGWLLWTLPIENLSWRRLAVPIIVLLYAVLQSLPLPLAVLALLSPARAERVAMVNDLAGAGLTLAPLGENGIIGLQFAIFLLALIIFFLALTALLRRDERFPQLLLSGIAAVGLAEALYGLMQVMNPGVGMLWLGVANPEAHGTIIYKNQYAALLNICWPLAIAGALLHLAPTRRAASVPSYRPSRSQRLARSLSRLQPQVPILFFAAGVMILAVLFSLSRGGILAMLTVSVLLNFLLPLSGRTRLAVTLGIVAFIAVYGSMLGMDGIIARFGTIEDYTGEFRLQIYQASLPMLFDHWLTGIGVDAYKLLSGVYLKGFPDNILIDRVHNDYLETAIEFGLPLAVLFVAWLVAGLWRSGRRLTTPPPAGDDAARAWIVGVAAFCALLGFLVHGLVDFGWRLPANAVYAVTLTALISWALAELERSGQQGEDTTAAVEG